MSLPSMSDNCYRLRTILLWVFYLYMPQFYNCYDWDRHVSFVDVCRSSPVVLGSCSQVFPHCLNRCHTQSIVIGHESGQVTPPWPHVLAETTQNPNEFLTNWKQLTMTFWHFVSLATVETTYVSCEFKRGAQSGGRGDWITSTKPLSSIWSRVASSASRVFESDDLSPTPGYAHSHHHHLYM